MGGKIPFAIVFSPIALNSAVAEDWLTELSNKELKNIFALRKEAVGS